MAQQDEYPVGDTSHLPGRIPIFPLTGVLLLPGAKLPLNIFEPRYLEMVRDGMAGDRLIGMVQPIDPDSRQRRPGIYGVGGAGRITAYEETDDGRILITLTGVSRFRVAEELDVTTGYRQVVADWETFAADRAADAGGGTIDRPRLLMALQAYLTMIKIPADWKAIEQAPSGPLVDNLAMICPFAPSEKQALLEAPDVLERSRVMTALIEMAVLQHAGGHDSDEDERPNVH